MEIILVIFVGLLVGSFSSALIYRIPRKMPWVAVRSACPSCQTVLSVPDLVPVISWVMTGGKCRHCKNKVSLRYILLELVSVILCLFVYWRFGLGIESSILFACVPVLMALFVIDIQHMILPNKLVFVLVCLGAFRVGFAEYFSANRLEFAIDYIGGAFIYAVLAWVMGIIITRVLKKDALGFGDVKFFFAAGLWLGVGMLSNYLILSGIAGVICASIWRMITGSQVFPFGPALIISFYSLVLLQGTILH